MADSHFCLEWDSHNKNICSALSSLQQSGEFVDMTLAADGHHVKVHQMVLALASPYIKELISSASCAHPVIFLNKVSYKTLCSILEYIYTGQAQVALEDIGELVLAARQLHIRGLEDVNSSSPTTNLDADIEEQPEIQIKLQRPDTSLSSKLNTPKRKLEANNSSSGKPLWSVPPRKRTTRLLNKQDTQNENMPVLEQKDDEGKEDTGELGCDDPLDEGHRDDDVDDAHDITATVKETSSDPHKPPRSAGAAAGVQYTVSNQGAVQLVLNRCLYSLTYRYRDRRRRWRCVHARDRGCPARVVTRDNVVLRRIGAHTHAFHDDKILKKVRAGRVYSALLAAQAHSDRDRLQPSNETPPDGT